METSLMVIFITGCVTFPVLYMTIVRGLKRYNHYGLSNTDIYVISEQIVCMIQAFSASTSGAIIMYNCQSDILHDQHWLTNAYAMLGAPYFYYDMVVMICIHRHLQPALKDSSWCQMLLHLLKRQPLIMVHHSIFPIIYLPVIVWWRQNLGDFFVGCFYLVELAVPCLSFRKVLIQLQKKNSVLYIVNGLLLIVTWILCRILIFPFLYWIYGRQCGASLLQVIMLIPKKCNIGCLFLLIFQTYWLVVMLRIAYRTLFSSGRMSNSGNKHLVEKQL